MKCCSIFSRPFQGRVFLFITGPIPRRFAVSVLHTLFRHECIFLSITSCYDVMSISWQVFQLIIKKR